MTLTLHDFLNTAISNLICVLNLFVPLRVCYNYDWLRKFLLFELYAAMYYKDICISDPTNLVPCQKNCAI